jgi:hypothetical protein
MGLTLNCRPLRSERLQQTPNFCSGTVARKGACAVPRVHPVDPQLHSHSPSRRPGAFVSSTRQPQLRVRQAGRSRSASRAVPADAPNRARFPNWVDPNTDFASIGRGKCERGRDPQFGATERHSDLSSLRVSAASRGKTARGWRPEISPLGAGVPASARRRASPTGGSAATASHGHSCHAFGCPFLRDLAASIKSSIGGCAERSRELRRSDGVRAAFACIGVLDRLSDHGQRADLLCRALGASRAKTAIR